MNLLVLAVIYLGDTRPCLGEAPGPEVAQALELCCSPMSRCPQLGLIKITRVEPVGALLLELGQLQNLTCNSSGL